MRLSLSSEGIASPADKIKGARVIFTPFLNLKESLKNQVRTGEVIH
jgi:hypothetical protein